MSIKELEKLSKLKEQGIISNEEFEREKKKLLNGDNKKQSNKNIGLIIAIILLGVLVFLYYVVRPIYLQATYKVNTNKVVEDVTRIVQEVRGLYGGKIDIYSKIPAGSESDDLLLSIAFRKPSDRHPFGGVYYISPAQYTNYNGYKEYFNVNITGLDKSTCSHLCKISSVWNEDLYKNCDLRYVCKYNTNNTLTLSFE